MPDTTVSISGNDYVVYDSVANGTIYLGARLDAAEWTTAIAAGADDEKRALVMATRVLETLSYDGAKTSSAQSLAFPRTGLTDRDGVTVSSSTIPQAMKDACFELALAFLKNSKLVNLPSMGASAGGRVAQTLKTGPDSVTFFGAGGAAGVPGALPATVERLIAPFLYHNAGNAYGTSEESQFDDADRYDLDLPLP